MRDFIEWCLLDLTAGEISGIITGVFAGIVAVIGAIGKVINDKRRANGNNKCCITGRELKPKTNKASKNNRGGTKYHREVKVKIEEDRSDG